MYTPKIPITIKSTPDKKKMETIKLAQPVTVNLFSIPPIAISTPTTIETLDIASPSPIANFNGLSENARMMSVPNLILFFKV